MLFSYRAIFPFTVPEAIGWIFAFWLFHELTPLLIFSLWWPSLQPLLLLLPFLSCIGTSLHLPSKCTAFGLCWQVLFCSLFFNFIFFDSTLTCCFFGYFIFLPIPPSSTICSSINKFIHQLPEDRNASPALLSSIWWACYLCILPCHFFFCSIPYGLLSSFCVIDLRLPSFTNLLFCGTVGANS